MSANDQQVGGDHYANDGKMQHWDMVKIFDLDYMQGQITRYLFRWRKKNGIEDLRKARHFIDKYIEQAQEEAKKQPANPRCEACGRRPQVKYLNIPVPLCDLCIKQLCETLR